MSGVMPRRIATRIARVLGAVMMVYVLLVAALELLIGYVQPEMEGGVVLTTTDLDGNPSSTMLAGFWLDEKLYVAANHWPRSWYHRAGDNPNVDVVVDGIRGAYTAVALEGAEHDRLDREYSIGFVLRLVCGFAPSSFLRLDPR